MESSTSIKGFTVKLPQYIFSLPLLFVFSRLFNRVFGKYLRISISRYSSTFSIYSSLDDSLLYSTSWMPSKDCCLNVGSGFFSHPYWVCVDLPAQSPIYKAVQGRMNHDFLPIDLNKKRLKELFKTETFNAVYSSHTLEHVSRSTIQHLFDDFYFILKTGGVFRMCVPDIVPLFHSARSCPLCDVPNQLLFFIRESYTPLYTALLKQTERDRLDIIFDIRDRLHSFSFDDCIQYIIKIHQNLDSSFSVYPPDFHISYPTAPFLMRVALNSGFSSYYTTSRGISSIPIFSNKFLFDTTIPDLSLYMEFVK